MKTKPRIEIDLAQVEAHAARGLSQEHIADALGVSISTLDNRKRESEDFRAAIKRGLARGIKNVANEIYESAVKGHNTTAAIFFLKTRAEWRETVIQKHTGHDGGAVKIEIVRFTDEPTS